MIRKQESVCGVRTVAIVLMIGLTAACSVFTDELDRDGARSLGRVASSPAWSADSRTIYYSDRASGGVTDISVHAIDVSSGNRRRLATVRGLNHGEQLRTASDPSQVFASIAHPDRSLRLRLYRIPAAGGTPQLIANNLGLMWYVVSSSGNRVAYTGSTYDADTIHVVEVTPEGSGAAVAIPSVGDRPIASALSPDGTQLIYSSEAGMHLVPSNGGTHRLLWRATHGTHEAIAPQVIWSGDTPHLLIASWDTAGAQPIEIHDVNALTGDRTLLATLPNHLPSAGVQLARSSDGASFAVWVPLTVTRENVERRTVLYRLYVKTPRHTELQQKLQWQSTERLRWFEFSPNGRLISLLLLSGLYLVEAD